METTAACQTCDPCQKSTWLFHGGRLHISQVTFPCPLIVECLYELLNLSQRQVYYLMSVYTFSNYRVSAPLWLDDSSHAIIALQINVCHTFSFLDHFKSDNNVLFLSQKVIQQWTDGCFILLTIHRYLLLLTSSKTISKRFFNLIYFWSAHFSKAVLSLKSPFPTKRSFLLNRFLENNQDKGVGNHYNALYWKFRILFWPFLNMVCHSFLQK